MYNIGIGFLIFFVTICNVSAFVLISLPPQLVENSMITSAVFASHDDVNPTNSFDEYDNDDLSETPSYRSNFQRLSSAEKRLKESEKRASSNRELRQNKEISPPSSGTRKKRQQVTDYNIDSFLRGEYDRPFAEDAAAPTPDLTPSVTIEQALKAFRNLDFPEANHGAAVFMRFCAPLSRSDRWGGGVVDIGGWKEVMRGALTPQMLTNRIRRSVFSLLLEWDALDVTDGLSVPNENSEILGIGSSVAFVNAAFYVGSRFEIVQFTLKKVSGVWLIDNAVLSKKEWFVQSEE